MKALIVFATYSGSTLTVAERLKTILENQGVFVDIKDVLQTSPSDISSYDLAIFGSCTWQLEHKDGQPHIGFAEFKKKLNGVTFPDKLFAVFALGDENYLHFCAAADFLTECVDEMKGKKIIDPLRINQYYFHEAENDTIIKHWSEELVKKCENYR